MQQLSIELGSRSYPIFIGEDAPDKTYAELTPSEKNAKSHRRQALDAFVAWLKTVDRAALA